MKLGIILALGGAAALAGCSSQATPTRTPTPTKPTLAPAATSVAATTPATTPVPTAATARQTTGTPITIAAGAGFAEGNADLHAHHYAAAIIAFRNAIIHHQHVSDAYIGLGTAALGLNNFATAYQAYRSAALLAPHNAAIVYYIAYAALHAQDYHGALTYATRYIQMKPNDVNGYHLRLLAYGHLYKPKAQIKDAQTIVRLQPHNAAAFNDLGIALGNDSQFVKSIAAFSKAIKLSPNNPSYYTNRAIAENLDKQPRLALQDLYTARSKTTDPVTRGRINLAIANLKKHLP